MERQKVEEAAQLTSETNLYVDGERLERLIALAHRMTRAIYTAKSIVF